MIWDEEALRMTVFQGDTITITLDNVEPPVPVIVTDRFHHTWIEVEPKKWEAKVQVRSISITDIIVLWEKDCEIPL